MSVVSVAGQSYRSRGAVRMTDHPPFFMTHFVARHATYIKLIDAHCLTSHYQHHHHHHHLPVLIHLVEPALALSYPYYRHSNPLESFLHSLDLQSSLSSCPPSLPPISSLSFPTFLPALRPPSRLSSPNSAPRTLPAQRVHPRQARKSIMPVTSAWRVRADTLHPSNLWPSSQS